jgi:hypothetical protein
MSQTEQHAALLPDGTLNNELTRRTKRSSFLDTDSIISSSTNVISAVSESDQATVAASTDSKHGLLLSEKERRMESATSLHTSVSQTSSFREIDNSNPAGQPCRKTKFQNLDSVAVLISIFCLVAGIVVVSPSLMTSWHMGFKGQIVAVGFLIGIMNICAEQVVLGFFLALEARHGKSRLQHYNAILATKFLSPHVDTCWRVTIILFVALPLGLSAGYKQFLGGRSSAAVKPFSGLYGVSFPSIGDWTPMNDPIYLQVSSNAAFYDASNTDNPSKTGSNQYPVAYGYNVLLLANDTAALLDLPTEQYLQQIRSKLQEGETWQLSSSVDAYVAAQNSSAAEAVRKDDAYWTKTLNESSQGLVSYYLSQDANSYIGMLPVVGQPFCWMGIFRGGPTSDSMYSISINDTNLYNFRKYAKLFSLSRQRCHATWQISASSMKLMNGVCDSVSHMNISQDVVNSQASGPMSITASPNLPHIFWPYVAERPNSTWLMPTYAVTTATSYWARGVYIIGENNIPGYNYTSVDEKILSARQTLDAVPLLYLCLAIQPVLTIAAWLIKLAWSLPISGEFGMIAVLAGVNRSNLDILGGAGFSGQLKRPLRLEISLDERQNQELGGMAAATVRYELKAERPERTRVPKIDSKTIYR